MIRLSNLADYAVVIMTVIASRAPEKLNATDVSSLSGVPQATAAKVMGHLARADLLVSHRGKQGGFALARAAEDICVADIIEALDGPIALTNCMDHGDGACNLMAVCGMRPHWRVMNDAVRRAFEDVSLQQLLTPRLVADEDLDRAVLATARAEG
ncbi:MAG: SUF system Fe-S cluster assembly regulator [Pseudomonadota bacterium]